MEGEIVVKRNVKDTVFTDLFSDMKYLLQLYRCLHPEDTEITAEQISNVTLKPILTNALYNDLGFMVEDRLVLLVEAQSTWTENIVVRSLLYLAQTYQEYLQDKNHPQSVYSTKKVSIPRPEFYVVYTGESPKNKEILSLSEEFFDGKESGIEVRVKVLYDGQQGDILNQYVAFTRVVNEIVGKYGRTRSAAEEIINICKSREILKEYLYSREKEVFNIMIALFSEEQIQRSFMESELAKAHSEGHKEGRTEGRMEGRMEGRTEERFELIRNMYFDVHLPVEVIAQTVKTTVQEVRTILSGMKSE